MKKIYSAGLKVVITFLLIFSSMQGITAKAVWDSTPPTIDSVQVDKNIAYAGETVTVTVNATDNDSSIKEVDVWYIDGKGLLNTFETSYNQLTGQAVIEIPITSISSLGIWKISNIRFTYENGTFNSISYDPNSNVGVFEVIEKPAVEPSLKINSIHIDKNIAHDGDTLTLTIDAIDSEFTIKDIDVWYNDEKGYLHTYKSSYNQLTKQAVIKIPITSISSLGNWTITKIWFYDENGDFKTVDPSNSILSSGDFEVLEKEEEEPSLKINSIQIDKNIAHDGDTLTLTIDAIDIDIESTIKDVDVWYNDEKGYLHTYKSSYNQLTKQAVIKIPITSISSLGKWTITKIWFYDENGMFKTVDASNPLLSGGNFEVVVKPDVESPVFKGISIDKNEVVLGNSNKVSIFAEDLESGIEEVKVSYLTPNGEMQTLAASFNFFKGSYEATIPVIGFSNLGNWQAASVYLRDKEGNEVTIYNSSLYSAEATTAELSGGNFQAIEDSGDSLATLENSKVYTSNIEFSNETINGDVYIGPNAVLTITGDVTINGDLHVFGSSQILGNLVVKGTWNVTKELDYIPIWLDNQPLTAYSGILNLSGKTLPFVTMYIEDQHVPINSDGTFNLNQLNVTDKQGITIKLIDLSGKEIIRQFLIKHEIKPAPSSPIVNKVSDKDTLVTGTAEAGSKVEVKINGVVISTGTVGTDGRFAVTIPMQRAGTELVLTVTDSFGKVSKPTTVVVDDATAPTAPQVNGVTDKDTLVTGLTEGDATVEIKVNGTVIASSTAVPDGQFMIPIPPQKAGTQLVVTAIDMARNVSEKTTTTVKDGTSPANPVVNEVTDKDTFVTGQAEAGALVEIKVNGAVIATDTVGTDGTFSISIPVQQAGTQLVVSAADMAGNVSGTTTVVVEDVTAPDKPFVNGVTDKNYSVSGQAEAGATVEIKVNGTVIGSGTAGSDGKFSIIIPVQQGGTELFITSTDLAGNVSEATSVIVVDVTPPATPVVNEVTDTHTSITGQAEAGAEVAVKANGTVIGSSTAGNDGKFSILIPVQKGGTQLTITATDKAGNVSTATSIIVRVTPPSRLDVNQVKDNDIFVTGETNAESTIEIRANGILIGSGTSTSDGKFSISIPKQSAGTQLNILAFNSAGGLDTYLDVTDGTAPAKPIVDEVMDNDTYLSGRAEFDSKVEIKVNGTVIGSGSPDEDNTFVIGIPAQKAGTQLMITATDFAGNVSEMMTVIVTDGTAPSKPIVTAVVEGDSLIKGTAEPGSLVTLHLNSVKKGTITADQDGRFEILLSLPLAAGTELTLTATDASGNESQTTRTIVKDVTPPKSPVVNKVTDRDLVITGTAEPGLIVTILYNSSGIIGTGVTGIDGRFSVVIPAYPTPGTKFSAIVTDAFGNKSQETLIITTGIGWSKIADKWYYYHPQTGNRITGWLLDYGKWYFLDSTGAMKTGWLLDGTTWYYLKSSGAMQTGWLQQGNTWYFLKGSGAMATGWLQQGNTWYYLKSSGAMQTGWLYSGGKWYYLKSGGQMQTGWAYISGKWYYFYPSGAMK